MEPILYAILYILCVIYICSILFIDLRIIFPADKAIFSAKLANSFFINSKLEGENKVKKNFDRVVVLKPSIVIL